MALPLGKLTVLVGAGILGSVLAKEGRLPSVSDFVSGAFKIAFKQIKPQDSNSSSKSKPIDASLIAQVNSLQQELQLLASNRPITIVTASGTGAGKYGTIVLIVVVGYGYVWWKGWKLPDMMFATRRSLSDACTSIAQQLENVYGSIRSTRRELSSNIEHMDATLDQVAALTANTREKVAELLEDSARYDNDVRNVHQTVQMLGQKISRIEEKQSFTMHGVKKLVDFTYNLENNLLQENTQASAKLCNAIHPPSSEPISPSASSGSVELMPRVQLPLHNAPSAITHQVDALVKGKTSGSKQPENGDFRVEGDGQLSVGNTPSDLMDTRESGKDENKIEAGNAVESVENGGAKQSLFFIPTAKGCHGGSD
ncbi:DNA binding protein, putative [Ricinus communis]|uniref:DNA binding protein, putative n=1 Tax=Ricinus communis TaxID=3988 RepID=B9SVJ5_RICCO|nr:DNA binding protein, putative [Ricinus communis]